MVRGCSVQVGIVISLELSVAHVHRGGKVSLVNFGSNVFGELYSFHERSAHNLVLADSDDWNGRLGRHLQDGTDSLNTLQSGQPTIIGASGTTALGMTENGGTSVQAQTLCEDVFDCGTRDLVELAVLGSFRDDHNSATLASFPAVLFFKKLALESMTACIFRYQPW